ncbi:MAG: hypothetical protein AAGF75_10540, partial [Cyanobacteria bacterium P01_H01_bin.130]
KASLSDRVKQRMRSNKSSGSGFGSSNLRNTRGARSQVRQQPRSSFGSNRPSRPSNFGSRSMARPRSFSGGRRRR